MVNKYILILIVFAAYSSSTSTSNAETTNIIFKVADNEIDVYNYEYTDATNSTTASTNSNYEVLEDEPKSFYDMKQIKHAIENAESILAKFLNVKRRPSRAQPEDIIQFYCANPTHKEFTQTYYDDPELMLKLDLKLPIAFIIHGWQDTATSLWAVELSEVWITYHNTNVCRIDWSTYAAAGYIAASLTKCQITAKFITKFLKQLHNNHGVSYKDITLAGHSLGAHVAGFIGQRLNAEIGKIFGLDPAGPLFTVPIILPTEHRLDATDANRVIVIHSCDGLLGVNIACGYQDFYPNKGKVPQPGCVWPSVQHTFEGRTDAVRCSHLRAVQYLIESLKPNNKCNGIQCNSIINYLLRTCTFSELLRVENIRKAGRYYFTTSKANCTGNYW